MAKDFHRQINHFVQKTKMRMGHFRRGVLIKLFAAIVRDTPVGNVDTWAISDAQKAWLKENGYVGGQLRGSWRAAIGTSPRGQVDGAEHLSEGAVVANMTGIVAKSKDDDTIYFVNRMPYASRIEFDGWSHTKAPAGMVRINVRRFHALVKKQLAETKASNP